jgi:hypothetical protein
MIDRTIRVVLNAVVVAVSESTSALLSLKQYPQRAWDTAWVDALRDKWVDASERFSRAVGRYVEQVRSSSRYRVFYSEIKKTLKNRYRQIRKTYPADSVPHS